MTVSGLRSEVTRADALAGAARTVVHTIERLLIPVRDVARAVGSDSEDRRPD